MGHGPTRTPSPLQLAILPWYSDGLVLKSKFLSVDGWLRLGTRLFVTVGIFLGALVGLSMLALTERQERIIGVMGTWVRLPPRHNVDRPELVHLGIVAAQLLGILAVLVTCAFVVAGS